MMFQMANFFPKNGFVGNFHTTPLASSVFMKRLKRVDPELAKQREARKRRKIEKEIRALQKDSKKPKPVDELNIINEEQIKDFNERQRTLEPFPPNYLKNMAIIGKKYNSLQNQLWKKDDMWMKSAINAQEKALERLKVLSPDLYACAIKTEDDVIKYKFHGPPQTRFQMDYESPDGDFIDVSKKWT